MPVLVREVVRGKALAQAVETVAVVDTDGNEISFQALLPDGSLLDPADLAQFDPTDPDGHGHGHDAQGNPVYTSLATDDDDDAEDDGEEVSTDDAAVTDDAARREPTEGEPATEASATPKN